MPIFQFLFSEETNPIVKYFIYLLLTTQLLALVMWILINIKYVIEDKKQVWIKEKEEQAKKTKATETEKELKHE
jgi:hypothetical protein